MASNSKIRIVNDYEPTRKEGVRKWFKWSIYLESDDEQTLDRIESVTYHLHPTFPVRDITIGKEGRISKTKGFRLAMQGWGTFEVLLDIHLTNGKKIKASHYLVFDDDAQKRKTELVLPS
jgi:transcription initiation factor IIF auxiliary subunit